MSEFRTISGTMPTTRVGALFNMEVEIQSPFKEHGPCQLQDKATPRRRTTSCFKRGLTNVSLGQPGHAVVAHCPTICTAASSNRHP